MTSLFRRDGMDGAKCEDGFYVLLLSLSNIASTSLIAMIFAWNGAFFSLNLTATNAAPLRARQKGTPPGLNPLQRRNPSLY